MLARLADVVLSIRPAVALAIVLGLFAVGVVVSALSWAWLPFAVGAGLGVVVVAAIDALRDRRMGE
ncbi:hypothetical protein [Prescottella agglutinans]|uniref:Uncharacterized protein n=1 Tax=Prescottella agglutinans TaxID=1644129 RepID=A0ABT6M5X7_9NOCA|nr:hypothetical protein [Prescottella agglutinans]MDH6279320.1 hypothetical protein [Prescottella agglutinans]